MGFQAPVLKKKEFTMRLFILPLFLCLTTFLHSQDIHFLRVRVTDRQQVAELAARGYQIADAKIFPTRFGGETGYDVRWMEENRYVTLISTDAKIDRAELEAQGFHVIAEGVHQKTVYPDLSVETIPVQFGWPRTMNGWPTIYGQATTIDDANNDGTPEIFLSNSEGWLYGWRPVGSYVLGYPQFPYLRALFDPQTGDSVYVSWASTASREGGGLGDINGDGSKEFVFGKDIGYIFAYQYNSIQIPGFPIDLETAYFSTEPALYDFDNDNKDEILIATYLWDSILPYGPAQVHIYNDDLNELPGWPQQLPVFAESSPAVGDIDGDNEMEIVVGSGRNPGAGIPGEIYAFNLDGSICDGFPIEVGNSVNCTPTIYDIDMNGTADILIRVQLQSTGINGIYAFDGGGSILPGFPAQMSSGSPNGAPAVADVNGDGLPEIAYGSVQAVDSGKVWLFSNTGQLIPGFPQPVYATWVEESVSLEDVSGDSLPDIVCSTNGLGGDPGALWAFDYLGEVVAGFPIYINETFSTLETTPTIVDIDGDGDTEIFTASHEGTVWVYDTPGVTAHSSWPTFKYDFARLGSIPPEITGIEPASANVPGQMKLYQNYPNPFNPSTNIGFEIADLGFTELKIFDVLGREVKTLVNRQLFPGSYEEMWDGTNNIGQQVSGGIYFYRLKTESFEQTRKMLLLK